MRRLLLVIFALIVATFLAVGCSRESSEAAKSAARDGGQMVTDSAKNVGHETKNMARTLENATANAAITAAVKMKLARDKTVKAMDIYEIGRAHV